MARMAAGSHHALSWAIRDEMVGCRPAAAAAERKWHAS